MGYAGVATADEGPSVVPANAPLANESAGLLGPATSATTSVAASDGSASTPTPGQALEASGSAATPAPPPTKPEDVRVGGTPLAKAAGSAHVIGQKQLDRFKYDDPHALLLTVPGVYARGEDGYGLRPNIGIRGANSDRSKKLTLMEDGVLFGPAPYSAPAAYYFPLLARMRSVRVIKGPGTVVYGPHTVGGAIDLVTQDIPASAKGSVDTAVGSFGYAKLHAKFGTSDEKFGFFAEGIHIGTTGFKTLDAPVGGDTGFSRNEMMVKGRYVLDPEAKVQNEFTVKLGYADEGSNETYVGLSDADFALTPYRRYSASQQDRMEYHRTQVAITHRAVFSKDVDITTTAYRHDLDRTWRKVNAFRGSDVASVLADPTAARNAPYYGVLTGTRDSQNLDESILIGPNHRVFVSQGVQTAINVRGKTGPVTHQAQYGFRLHYDEIIRRHTEDGFAVRGGALVSDGTPTAVTADNKAYTDAIAFHLTDTMGYGDLTVSPGARVELIHSVFQDSLLRSRKSSQYGVVVPGVGAHYALTPQFGVLGGVSKGFSPAPPGERDSKPESSVNYEGGLRYASRTSRVEVIGFFNDYSNLTSNCTAGEGCADRTTDRQFDAGSVWIYGVEGFLETEIKLPRELVIPLRATYTYTGTKFLSTFNSADPQYGFVLEGDELPYVPKHQASGMIGLEGKRFALDVSGTFVGKMREKAGSAEDAPMTDAYFLLDASASFKVNRFARVYMNGRNLADSAYLLSRRPFGARPGSPRAFQVGLKVEF